MGKVVLLADNQMIVRKGLRTLLEKHLSIKDVEDVSSSREVMSQLKSKKFTHLVMEIMLSDGSTSSVIPIIRQLYANLHILIFTNVADSLLKQVLSGYGVYHIVSKNTSETETIKAFEKFFRNELSPRSIRSNKDSDLFNLTPRELEIYTFMLNEKSTGEIARELNIKKNTVSTMKHRIFKKTKTENPDELKLLNNLQKSKANKN